jgi:glycerol-3-phosphate acyltransferase PlsX
MVCEGFTGNVILKLAESLHGIAGRQHSESEYFDRFDFEYYGGTPILGITKPVIIGHGISRAKSFLNMLRLTQKMIGTDLMGKMKSSFLS